MSDKSPNYYEILGVTRDSTKQEIASKYAKLIQEYHPDKIEGLKNKYKATNDSDLLKVLEQAIAQAEEKAKLLNEAYAVLSNPNKRRLYDSTLVDIEIKPSRLSVGSIIQGRKVEVSFMIENKGGTISSINIDWGRKPTWGELTIVPNLKNTFPIKVMVAVSTVGLSPNSYEEQINIEADGERYNVPVSLRVIAVPKVVATPKKVKPSHSRWKIVTSVLLIALLIMAAMIIEDRKIGNNNTPPQSATPSRPISSPAPNYTSTPYYSPTPSYTPTPYLSPTPTIRTGYYLSELESVYNYQNKEANRIELEREIARAQGLVRIERINDEILPCPSCEKVYGYYRVTNLSKYSVVKTDSGSQLCDFNNDTYETLSLLDQADDWNTPLYPGGERVYRCTEYYYWGDGWDESGGDPYGDYYTNDFTFLFQGFVRVYLENQIGTAEIEDTWLKTPRLDIDLSENVQISLKEMPTEDPSLTAIFELVFSVDSLFPYKVGVCNVQQFPGLWMEKFYVPDPSDPRLFVKERLFPLIEPGTTITRYLLISQYVSRPSKFCLTLSAPYIRWETVCIAT